MGKKGQEVATRDSALPANLMEELEQNAGVGLEGASTTDYAIPFINVLQALSPQVQKDDPKFQEGASPGDLYDTVLQERFDGQDGVEVIPVHFEKQYNEWIPRKSGGGFVASYATKEEAHMNAADGNDLIDTALHYVLYRPADGMPYRQAIISCTSTKLKVSRNWNSRMATVLEPGSNGMFNPPTYGQRWLLKTVKQENNKGKFYNLSLEYLGLVPDAETLAAAKAFRSAVLSGEKGADLAAEGSETGAESAMY